MSSYKQVKSLGYLGRDVITGRRPADWVINFQRGLASLISLRHPEGVDRDSAQSYTHPMQVRLLNVPRPSLGGE